jgi:pimeloyl-ACP methyl ester carboxylesterase
MVPARASIDGRVWHYAVSDNEVPGGAGPTWALNLHGYLASGAMYWRESARLAAALGWRVVTPSLPGFGGSAPLPAEGLTLHRFAEGLAALCDHLGAGPVVLLGDSMGGALAVRFATDYPGRTLGVVYRDGAATPAWKERRSPVVALLSPVSPDLGAMVDLLGAAVCDLPDLAAGRLRSNLRSLLPDARRNFRSVGQTIPVAALLFACDLREEVAALGAAGEVPLLGVWGRFDRIATRATAREFARLSGAPVVWVNGGHSWMLARPGTQARVLTGDPVGRAFVTRVQARRAALGAEARPARATGRREGLSGSWAGP